MQVVVDGILTHYETIGKKSKKLLIVPGWMHTINEWLPVAKQLSEQYTVILLDLPGFGKTEMPKTAYTIYDYSEFVSHFLHKIDSNNVTVIGHSFGGRISIIMATKTNVIQKLVLVDAAGIEKRTTAAKLKISLFKCMKLFLPKKYLEKLRNKIGSRDYKNAGKMRDIFVKIINEDLTYLLPKIAIPVLLVWGNNDTEVEQWKIKLMKKLIPHSRLKVIWNAAHSPHVEKPDVFIDVLKDFLFTQ